ncbi:Predicted arabinose efflux permease, MFS family [Paenibacillus sp. UNC496MF]|uniref:MFS transporter n=1 Tax=Paenibacillus sp. UNC496MF TaxID=1502753 RepID=UPI0008EFD734|nr:MFS transporter [Paenibacillus sp. UNC496MF]SFJ73131.1 Predicted arabinose efflux permease, MFS family [Paenibacillus sp. UNC496MF]
MSEHALPSTAAAGGTTALSRGLLLLMALSAGMTVANLYYNQPLLADIGRSFGVGPDSVGLISTCTQIGYALGMFLFVPLGDIKERKGLITVLLALVCLSLIGVATAQNLPWIYIASLAVGVTTVVPQILVPLAATLAAPGESGKAVGTVMSGLLLGILLTRTVSGLIGGTWGWRVMYAVAAAAMLALLVLLRVKLPTNRPSAELRYGRLLASMGSLVKRYATLRESALIGAANFAAFSVFWTALAFYIEGPPYGYGSRIAGLFGLVGAAGALGAPIVGRMADRFRTERIIGVLLALNVLSFLLFGAWGGWLWALIAGVLLMDLGVQGTQVANMARIYALEPAARSRINTVQMVTTFLGGAIGSSLGSFAWNHGGWRGVCLAGGGSVLFGFVVWALHRVRR